MDGIGNSQAAGLSECRTGETEAGKLRAPFRFVEAATDPDDQGGLANLGARGGRNRRAEGSVLLFLGSSPFAPVIIIEIIGSGEFKQEDKPSSCTKMASGVSLSSRETAAPAKRGWSGG